MAKKKYAEEFKADAIRLAREARRSGKNTDEVARGVGVHPNTLADWVRRDDSLHAGDGTNTEGLDPKTELEQLRKENRILKMEREILKKAAANSTTRRNTDVVDRSGHDRKATTWTFVGPT